MEFHFLPILAFLSLTLVASHATLSPEAYWNSVLPNSPMPTAVKDLLHPEWMEDKSTAVGVGKGGVGVDAGQGKKKESPSLSEYQRDRIHSFTSTLPLRINSMIIPTSLFSSWKMT
ncbi:hypothetical protein CsSME_00044091 [Camellia sinensis var. sinensis]